MAWLTGALVISVLTSTLTLAAPLIFGALGGVVSERAGVVNIAIEGAMLVSAFMCAVAEQVTNSIFLGIVAGFLAGGVVGLVLAVLTVSLRIDQVVAGFVVNIAAAGATAFLLRSAFNSNLSPGLLLNPIDIPALSGVGVIGPILFQQNLLVYLALALVPLVHIYLFRTKLGLRSRAVSENPRAADVAGIAVERVRYGAVIASGLLSGLAGAYLIVGSSGNFSEGLTSGKGFIALAAVIFGKWRPIQASLGALLFGFCLSLEPQLQFTNVPIPLPVLYMIPYLVTVIVLAGFIGRAVAPAADGVPYVKE